MWNLKNNTKKMYVQYRNKPTDIENKIYGYQREKQVCGGVN